MTEARPAFTAYLRGMDLRDRIELGLLPEARLQGEEDAPPRARSASPLAGIRGILGNVPWKES